MTAQKNLDVFIRAADGSYSCAYGPYTLDTAYQPLLEPRPHGTVLAGYQGQIRIERNGDRYTPSEFAHAVDIRDMGSLDRQLASLHLRNAAIFAGTGIQVHVARTPRHFHTLPEMRADAETLKSHAIDAGLEPRNVVCELQLRDDPDPQKAALFAAHLRRAGFLIGIEGYSGEERDMQWLSTLRPSFVRFDPIWMTDLLHHSAGFALMRVIIRQFREQNVQTIAPGIEEEDDLALLERSGVCRLQGHAISRPMTVADAAAVTRQKLAPRTEPRPEQQVTPSLRQVYPPSALPARTALHEAPETGMQRPAAKRNAPAFGRRGLA